LVPGQPQWFDAPGATRLLSQVLDTSYIRGVAFADG